MKQIHFIPGLGEKPHEYKALSKYLSIVDVDWNTGKMIPVMSKLDILVGFSMGACLSCIHAEKYKVKNLILCSLTPGEETLKNVKADFVTFLVGEKEQWVLKDLMRVRKTLKCKSKVVVIPNTGHKITSQYQKKLIEIVQQHIDTLG